MQSVVPAFLAFGRGVGDVLPGRLPPHLVAPLLHLSDILGFGFGLPHAQVDGSHELELPALTPDCRAVLAGTHGLVLGVPLGRLQYLQTMGAADLIADLPLPLEVSGVLVELAAILPAHAVDDEVVVEVVGVHMSGDYHLELWEQPLGQFQTDGVDLLWGDVLRWREGLDELVEHPAIGFPEPPLSGHHLT